jgi:hypothetical protein
MLSAHGDDTIALLDAFETENVREFGRKFTSI